MSTKHSTLTQERLKELLHYDPDTGIFIWVYPVRYGLLGKPAGLLRKDGYLGFVVGQKHYLAHRLAWLYTHGEFPEPDIDHINHCRDDNRIDNLRVVDRVTNSRNRREKNKNGLLGVYWHSKHKKWQASIGCNYKTRHLGMFSNFFDACCARKSAENKHGFHENHGREL